jgi:hypothetical protein
MNYQLIYNEDYFSTTMILNLANNYKYLNLFGIIHLKHKEGTSFNCIKKGEFHLSNIFFPNYLNDFYVKNNQKDIHLIVNYLFLNKFYQTQASFIYKKFFDFNIRNLLFNNYVLPDDKKKLFELFNITKNQTLILSTYASIMTSEEFHSIIDFQNSIFNASKINKDHINYIINYKKINSTKLNKLSFHYIYNNDSNSNIDINKIIKLKYKKNYNPIIKGLNQKVSIIIYCNEINYLEETLISIIEQKDFFFFEIIIVYDNFDKMHLSDNFKYNNIFIIKKLYLFEK